MVFFVCIGMNNSRFLFLPPLLVSILLFTVGNLKLGIFLNRAVNFIFSPITIPIQSTRVGLQNSLVYLKDLPNTNRQLREQKVLISHLVWENETLKQTLKDTKNQTQLKNSYQKVLPVKISSHAGKIFATSSQSTQEVIAGMPVVSGNILLGLVTDINDSNIGIISLESNLFPAIPIKGVSGPEGVYRYNNGTSQIINVPSQTPIILGDFVLTETSDLIPANLLIGKITKLLTTPQEPIQKGEITIYDNLQNSPDNLVIIVKP